MKEIPFVDIHTHHFVEREGVVALFNLMWHERAINPLPPDRPYSLGVHPWFMEEEAALPPEEAFHSKNVVAIGEAGLDKLRGVSSVVQQTFFRYHIQLSETLSKPLIIHNVRMTHEIVAHYDWQHPKMPWILHGFIGNSQQVQMLLKRNFYFSLGTPSFRSTKTVEALPLIPVERLFLETDEGTHPIEYLYQQLSEARDIPLNTLKELLFQNFHQLFSSCS